MNVNAQQTDSLVFDGEVKGEGDTGVAKWNIEITGEKKEEEEKPKELKLNVEKISLKKYYGWYDSDLILHLPNKNGIYPQINKITTNEFFISGKTSMSIAPDQITPNISYDTTNSDNSKLIITENSFQRFLGKYEGSITLEATGYDPTKIPVEFELRWNPTVLIIITASGLILAWAVDVKILERGKKQKRADEMEKIKKIIKHLNRHVDIWNHQKLRPNSFKKLKTFHDQSLEVAHEMENGKPSKSLMTLELAEELLEHYHKARDWVYVSVKRNRPIDNDDNNKFDDYMIKETEKDNNAESDDEKSLKHYFDVIAVIITGLTSIPIALLGVNYFPNHVLADGILAGLIGFGLYSSKEIGKIIRDKKIL